jgi:predicted methyltransferase
MNVCEKCGKEFKTKSQLSQHQKRKTPCTLQVVEEQRVVESKEQILACIDKLTSDELITDNIKLYFGDCLEKMKNIGDNSVDLVLCDLPYGTTKCKWDSIIDLEALWKHYTRIVKKPSGVVLLFGQQPFTSKLISSNYDCYK